MAGALSLSLSLRVGAAVVVEGLLGSFSLRVGGQGALGQMASSGIVSGEKGLCSGFGE